MAECENRLDKILSDTSIRGFISDMAEGNIGAMRVLHELLGEGETLANEVLIPGGGIGLIGGLDWLGIYGPRIWMLYKDVCEERLAVMIALMLLVRFGDMKKEALDHAIDNNGDGIDINEVIKTLERHKA